MYKVKTIEQDAVTFDFDTPHEVRNHIANWEDNRDIFEITNVETSHITIAFVGDNDNAGGFGTETNLDIIIHDISAEHVLELVEKMDDDDYINDQQFKQICGHIKTDNVSKHLFETLHIPRYAENWLNYFNENLNGFNVTNVNKIINEVDNVYYVLTLDINGEIMEDVTFSYGTYRSDQFMGILREYIQSM